MEIIINPDYCKGCNLCVLVCPRGVFEEGHEVCERGHCVPRVSQPEKCPNWERTDKSRAVCELCSLTCPDHAISLEEEDAG
ncbi:MAG: ferredoxin family protein [Methanomassiliicoccales archaeon]